MSLPSWEREASEANMYFLPVFSHPWQLKAWKQYSKGIIARGGQCHFRTKKISRTDYTTDTELGCFPRSVLPLLTKSWSQSLHSIHSHSLGGPHLTLRQGSLFKTQEIIWVYKVSAVDFPLCSFSSNDLVQTHDPWYLPLPLALHLAWTSLSTT